MDSFLSPSELEELSFARIGKNVMIDRSCRFYGASRISMGDNVRIDAFSVLSAGVGGIHLGSFIHLSAFVCILGAGRVDIGDFVALSVRVSVFSSNDDYSGEFMTNPTVGSEFTNVDSGPVTIGRHAVIGAGSVILPNVQIGEGGAVGALSFVNKDIRPFTIAGGIPAVAIKKRSDKLLQVETEFQKNKIRL